MKILLLAAMLAGNGAHWPTSGVNSNGGAITGGWTISGACASMASGQVCCYDKYGVQCGFPLTDAAPLSTLAYATSASPVATGGNQTGANYKIAGGEGTITITCTQANCGVGDTVSLSGGVTKTCTRDAVLNDSTHFTCGASDAAMCTNVAACLATATGVSACAGAGCTLFTGVAGVAYVYPASDEPGVHGVTAASSGDHAVVVNGTDGSVEAVTALVCDAGTTTTTLATSGAITQGAASPLIQTACTATIADNGAGTNATLTMTPVCSSYQITCSDANGCDITLGESTAQNGQRLEVTNMSTVLLNFSDSATVSETAGAVSIGQYDTAKFKYLTDRWAQNGAIERNSTNQIIAPDGTAGAPGISFAGDLQIGIYNAGGGVGGLSAGGFQIFQWLVGSFRSNNGNGPQLTNAAASSTVPTLVPRWADATSGWGSQASGNISGIAGGAEKMRISSSGAQVLDDSTGLFWTSGSGATAVAQFVNHQDAVFLELNNDATFGGHNFVVGSYLNRLKSYPTTNQTNPMLWGFSAADPSGAPGNTYYWSLTHNQTDTVLKSGAGAIDLVTTTLNLGTSSPTTFISTATVSTELDPAGGLFKIGGNVTSTTAGRFELVNADASATVPTLVPSDSSSTTGFGAGEASAISAITGGTERFRIISNNLRSNNSLLWHFGGDSTNNNGGGMGPAYGANNAAQIFAGSSAPYVVVNPGYANAMNGKDFGHGSGASTIGLYINSTTDPTAGDATQWMGLGHDTANGWITTGKGYLGLSLATGAVDLNQTTVIVGKDRTTDAAAYGVQIKAGSPWAQASTNKTGADLFMSGGETTWQITVLDNTLIDNGVDTITVDSWTSTWSFTQATTTLTAVAGAAGANQFSTDTSTTATATSIAAAFNTISGFSATPSSNVVYVTVANTLGAARIRTTFDAGEGTLSNNSVGGWALVSSGNVSTAPGILKMGSNAALTVNRPMTGDGNANTPGTNYGSQASSTSPVFIPRNGTATAGIGSQAAGNVSIIANAQEKIRIHSTGSAFIHDAHATLGVGVTTFAIVQDTEIMTGDGGGNTVSTITGGVDGQRLMVYCTDNKITLTDTAVAAATAGQLVLNGAFTCAAGTLISFTQLPVGAAGASVWVESDRSPNG